MLFLAEAILRGPHPVYFSPCTTFLSGLRHVPYEEALQQLRLFSLTHRGDLVSMFKVAHGPPSHIQPSKGYATTPASSTSRDVVRAIADSPSPFGLSHFGTTCRLRQPTHPWWNPSRHSWMPTGSPCSPKYPSNPPPPTTHFYAANFVILFLRNKALIYLLHTQMALPT